MRIEVLGTIQLRADTGEIVPVPERKVRLLLAALVASDGESVSSDALIDRVWGDRLPADPKAVLTAKLSQLRGLLNRADGRDMLNRVPGGYRLNLAPDTTDAGYFVGRIDKARDIADPAERTRLLNEALDGWCGEPYSEMSDQLWLAPTITNLRETHLSALELRAESLVESGSPETVIEQYGDLVTAHPTRERLVAAMMTALYQVGRQQDALRLYGMLRHQLAEDLGADPGPAVRELHGRILRQESELTEPPGRAARGNLPIEVSPLIGRKPELTETTALLHANRLLTLTGIGGVGKTRLALRLARLVSGHFDGGVWFLDLTQLCPASEVAPQPGRVAELAVTALNLSVDVGHDDLTRVRDAVGDRATLFVLDNCEHLVDEAAEFASRLLATAPGATILATSREPLGLVPEQRFQVPTLDTRSDDEGTSAAAEFFITRARAVSPAFTLDDDIRRAVTELCRRLDGLPLALELAANRVAVMSVPDLLNRLTDRLQLLARPDRGAPRRQQTLRGMIDWSWSLLDEVERAVLRRLAVHYGSLTLEAAEATCSDPDISSADVVTALLSLVDRSLVVAVATPTGTRYTLLESIAAYAAEKLGEADEREAVARRHLEYFLDLTRRADDRLRGPEQRHWIDRLTADRVNIQDALYEAVAEKDGDSAVRLVLATFNYHWMTGRLTHLPTDFATAISLPGPRGPEFAAVSTLHAAFTLAEEPDRTVERVTEALALFTPSEDLPRAHVQWFAGTSLMNVREREAGERLVTEAIDIFQRHGSDWGVGMAACQRDWFRLSNWGLPPIGLPDGRDAMKVLAATGDGFALTQALGVEYRRAEAAGEHDLANEAAEAALSWCLDVGLRSEASYWIAATAITAVRSGDLDTATTTVERAKRMADETAFNESRYLADLATAMIMRTRRDLGTARKLLDNWMSNGGAARDQATLFEHGFLSIQEGRIERAADALEQLLPLVTTFSEKHVIARIIELRAAILARSEQAESAAVMLGVAETLRDTAAITPTAPEVEDLRWIRDLVAGQVADEESARARGRRYVLDTGITPSDLAALTVDGLTLTTRPATGA